MKKLGFFDNVFIEKYEEILDKIVYIHRNIAAIEEKDWDIKNEKSYYDFNGVNYLPTRFTIIDFLVLEYRYKKEKLYKIKKNNTNLISATDLANYTYCPIGYSIGQTFQTPKNQLGEVGSKKHEEHCLFFNLQKKSNVKHIKIETEDDQITEKIDLFDNYRNDETNSFFDDLDNSELIYYGHNIDNEEKYFINNEKGFIGQPDYILKNSSNKYFVIEEKFKRSKYSNENYFFSNHKVQLASYIYFLNKYKIEYGYLVYWLYDYKDYNFEINKCKVLRVNRNNNIESYLLNKYDLINNFKTKKYLNVKIDDIDPVKCANCVYVFICAHKNKRQNQVSLPYQSGYFNLYYAKYPEELKKVEIKNEINDEE